MPYDKSLLDYIRAKQRVDCAMCGHTIGTNRSCDACMIMNPPSIAFDGTTAVGQQRAADYARWQATLKGRQVGKSAAMRDWADKHGAQVAPRVTFDSFPSIAFDIETGDTDFVMQAPPDMPALYPRLERVDINTVLLTLPFRTPGATVVELAMRVPLKRLDDYRCTFAYRDYDIVQGILMKEFGNVEEDTPEQVDPHAPIELFVEYIGACRARDGQRQPTFGQPNPLYGAPGPEPYASAWVDGGWNVVFPESVLKRYFPPEPAKFDGDWYKTLLNSEDMPRAYKQFARQWHPDLNKAKGAAEMFDKLTKAYRNLSDPEKRKRYEAGQRFALATVKAPVQFRIPKSCGKVQVRGEYKELYKGASTYGGVGARDVRRLHVTEIIRWDDIFDERGNIMCATWRHVDDAMPKGTKPFIVTYEDTSEFVIDV